MSASHAPALSAIAFQLTAALENYEAEIASLAQGSFDPELYRHVSRRMDEMRLYAAALPPVSVAWVEVMIRHFEFTHGLWRQQQAAPDAPDLQALLQRLQEAVRQLAHKCVQLMPAA